MNFVSSWLEQFLQFNVREDTFAIPGTLCIVSISTFFISSKKQETIAFICLLLDECGKLRGRGARVSPQIWNLPGILYLIVSKPRIPLR